MAGRGPQTFQKRQKEQQRKEKQQEKASRREDRKAESANREPGSGPPIEEAEEMYIPEEELRSLGLLD